MKEPDDDEKWLILKLEIHSMALRALPCMPEIKQFSYTLCVVQHFYYSPVVVVTNCMNLLLP